MAENDWAIVAGLTHYPELGDLEGPENDARAFHHWLITQGGVPPAQARLILSSDFQPPATAAQEAQPDCGRIEAAFDALVAVAEENERKMLGEKVGRRLYIFLAGHGCTPAGETRDAALLMANATPRRIHHIPGRPYANWFLSSGYFEEVVLFMDCCRERYPQVPLSVLPYVDLTDPSAVDRGKLLYGFATKWSHLSRGKRMPDGAVRGVFTTALLAGLENAVEDGDGEITARSLADYLYNNMKNLLSPEDLEAEGVSDEPEIIYDHSPSARFVIARVGSAPRYPVKLSVRPEDAGKSIQVLDSHFARVAEGKPQAGALSVELPPGSYLGQVPEAGRQQPFEVSGMGGVDVQL